MKSVQMKTSVVLLKNENVINTIHTLAQTNHYLHNITNTLIQNSGEGIVNQDPRMLGFVQCPVTRCLLQLQAPPAHRYFTPVKYKQHVATG